MRAAPTPAAELVSLLEQMPGCRILIDTDFRVVATNSSYTTCCGAGSPDSVVGRRCYEVSHDYAAPCDSHGETCPMRAAMSSGQLEHAVHVHHTARGPEHVEVEVIPLRDARGKIAFFAESMRQWSTAGDPNAFVGRDPAFLRTLDLVKRVATTDTSVLLLGETGSGKEVMARALHDASRRAGRPFVVVDCSGLAETLFESELFGHEKGAFTGAVSHKPGLVEAAAGGTLFIDEIGEVPLPQQVKLLRLLETGLYRHVGGTDMRQADFRLVAATHRDLRALVDEGRFRADLYYRISAFPIEVPALRQRPTDIPLLAKEMLARLSRGDTRELTPAALKVLAAYDFPGNVRELRNVIERAALLAGGDRIDVQHLPADLCAHAAAQAANELPPTASPLAEAEREALRRAVREHTGNRRDLARRLGLSERTLYRKIRGL